MNPIQSAGRLGDEPVTHFTDKGQEVDTTSDLGLEVLNKWLEICVEIRRVEEAKAISATALTQGEASPPAPGGFGYIRV